MKSILPIIKKELKRFFTDKRLLATLILPGVAIYIIYSFMGIMFNDLFSVDEDFNYVVYIANEPDDALFESLLRNDVLTITVKDYTLDKDEEIKQMITDEKVHLLIIYPENFDPFNPVSLIEGENKPQNVEIFYNIDCIESNFLYTYYSTALVELESKIVDAPNIFDVNNGDGYNLSPKAESTNPMAMMIPMLLMIFLVSGVVATATESIAGEKERGTIATLLVTPISRVKLSFAKILAISIPSMLSALSSFIGLTLSLPKLLEFAGDQGFDLGLTSFPQVISLLAVILITVLVFTVLISIISTYSKSVKESQQLTSPILIIASMSGLVTMFFTNPDLYLFFIPILNSTLLISNIFDSTFTLVEVLITLGVNIVFIVAGIFIIGKMFNSEKIIFNK